MKRRDRSPIEPDGYAVDRHLEITVIKILRSRAALKQLMPKGFINDPALEILLNLYVARKGKVLRSAIDAAISANASRWITALAHEGLVEASPYIVGLSAKGAKLVEDCLELVLDRQMDVR